MDSIAAIPKNKKGEMYEKKYVSKDGSGNSYIDTPDHGIYRLRFKVKNAAKQWGTEQQC